MNGSYSPVLVVLSVIVAIGASYTALDLANSLTVARGRARSAWLVGGALAMGAGIWSMHFVGMLAFRMPGMAIAYDVWLLMLSVAVAVAASGLALWVVSRPQVGTGNMLLAALAMGAAIAGMHYIGMWSMHMPARIRWSAPLVGASIAIAVGASFAALWLAFRYRSDRSRRAMGIRAGGAVVEGFAIAGMHYTAMAAAHFTPVDGATSVLGSDVLATPALGVAVTGTTLMLLAIAVTGSVVGRELARRRDLAEENERLYHNSQELAVELEATVDELQTRSEELERTNSRLRMLQYITDAALVHLRPDELLEELLRRVCEVLRCDTVSLLLRSDDGESLVPRASRGLEEVTERTEIPYGEGVVGQIAATGEPAIIADLRDMPEAATPLLREQIRSLIGVPLLWERRVIGVLHVGTREPRHFTDDDLALLTRVAERSASALEHARLFEASLAANRAKSEFLASMSHELRTPLNAVIGYTDLLEMGVRGEMSEDQLRYLQRIRTSSGHLLGLINDVLDLAKLESGRMALAREQGSLWEAVSDSVGLVQPLADRKALELVSRCSRPGDPHFEGDADRVRQIVVNLLSNAIKFTDEHGRVIAECGSTDTPDPGARLPGGEWAYVRVEDTGVGLDPEHLESIFHPFVQVDSSLTRARGGTGLGLTISRQFARSMGGDITVRSTPGQGSCFTLWLPASKVEIGDRVLSAKS